MLDVLIVRHAQSEWNAAGRWQGQADPPLSELGIAQAQVAAGAIGTFDVVIASDLDRAVTTARIVAEAMGVGPVVTDAGWRERDVGEWQELTRPEIEAAYPDHLGNGRYPPGWESNQSVLDRALASLARVAEQATEGNALVVAHGGVIYTLEGHLGAEFAPIRNLHGRWFHLDGDRLGLGERVALAPEAAEQVPDL